MSPKELAKFVVKYHSTKKDKPDPNCCVCNGTGIDVWYNGHNGNEERSECKCLRRTLSAMENKYEPRMDLSLHSKTLLKICKEYLKE